MRMLDRVLLAVLSDARTGYDSLSTNVQTCMLIAFFGTLS
jgi:hypothetical protein